MRKKISTVLVFLLLAAVIYVQHIQLTYSASIAIHKILTTGIIWQTIDILIVILPFLFFLILSSNVLFSVLMNSILIFVFSVVNYYVLLFHGSPLFAGDFLTFRTAMNVVSEYQFAIDKMVFRLAVIFVFELLLIALLFFLSKIHEKKAQHVKRAFPLILFLLDLGIMFLLFFSPYKLFSNNLLSWNWTVSVSEYGYEIPFVNSIYSLQHAFQIPEGYDADKIVLADEDLNTSDVYEKPDIILILNETLADISKYADIPEGKDVFSAIYDRNDVICGYSVVSMVGGGTNNSEFELLTSNSMRGLSFSAPFQYLNMKAVDSLVTDLKSTGYSTVAMHCGDRGNYSRNRAYYEMGFDHVYLGAEEFTNNQYGNRSWLDSDNYSDMIEIYNHISGDSPKLMYILTLQNHGGYEQNSSDFDTVQISGDYGDLTDDINEYLTSVQLSSQAFCQLIDYYSSSKRPVIILMVGDHAPAFVSQIVDNQLGEMEREIAERTVPYFVWSNMSIDRSVFTENTTMVDLVPMMLESANMPISNYYASILALNKKVPIRLCNDIYADSKGLCFKLDKQNEYYDQLLNYYYMEYNRLIKGKDYIEELFLVE